MTPDAPGTAAPAGDLARARGEEARAPHDDAQARAEALDPRRSFIVRAPAGSGKTALLTQRLLRLLAEAETPEEIVAITFTRKAAAEMRERLLGALRLGERDTAPDAPMERALWPLARAALANGAARGWSVVRHPNRLHIQTIDGFCHALARRHPWRSGLGGPVQTAEDAEPLYREAARATLRLLDSRGDAQRAASQAVAHLLRHRDVQVDQVEDLLVRMLARRDQWLRHLFGGADGGAAFRKELERALARIVVAALKELREEAERAALRLAPENPRAPGPPGPVGRELARRLARLARYAAKTADAQLAEVLAPGADLSDLPGSEPEALAGWRAIRTLLLTQSGEWRKRAGVTVRIGFPPGKPGTLEAARKADLQNLLSALAAEEPFRERLAQLERLPSPAYTDAQWETLSALVTLLRQAVTSLRERFGSAGVVDFVEIAQAAERVASEPGWSAEAGIRHLLVDEFQDSSHAQYRLIEQVTANWRPGDGRTLFLVGDPMQSIYRFREADVGLFLAAERDGIGSLRPEALRLERNFRSVPGIIESNNRTFAAVFPPQPDALRGAVTYAPSQAARVAGPAATGPVAAALGPVAAGQLGPGVHLHPIVVEADAEDDAAREADVVAELAHTALDQQPESSVAILVQARSHLEAILPALARARVPVQAVALNPLDHQPAVLDLLSLTRALLYPGDRIAWLAVLRAPWCGLGLGDLEALALGTAAQGTVGVDNVAPAAPGEEERAPERTPPESTRWDRTLWDCIGAADTLPGLSPSARTRLRRLQFALAPAVADVGRQPLRRTVEAAWLALGGPACVAPADDGDVRSFLDLLEGIEAEGVAPSPEELGRRLAGRRSAPGAVAGPVVQVMTIHEAKGLEFDTVILPGLHRSTARDTRPLLRWLEHPTDQGSDLVLAPIPAAGSEPDAIHRYLDDVELARTRNERQRLLYVACTRAKEQLHLIGVARTSGLAAGQASGAVGLKAPRAGTLLAALWPTVEAGFAAVQPAQASSARAVSRQGEFPGGLPEPAPLLGLPLTRLRLAADWTLPPLPPRVAAHEPAPVPLPAAEPVVFDWAGPEARLVGTVVHALLQRIAREGFGPWEGLALQGQHAAGLPKTGREEAVAKLLIRTGLVGPTLGPAKERVLRALRQALADPRGRWVLGPHGEAQEEWELTARVDGRPRRMTLDRTFVDADGVRWVVDYKTGSHLGGSLDEFLDRERERYRPQLERYARALRALEPRRPIRCGLYFPLAPSPQGTGGWRDWEFSPLDPI